MIKERNESLIKRLEELNRKGMSKTDMASIANVSKQAVTGWFKTGAISKKSAIAIADAAGVSVAWLLGENVDEESGLSNRKRKLLELFNQLPEDDQDKFLTMMKVRLEEIDNFIAQYQKTRLTDS